MTFRRRVVRRSARWLAELAGRTHPDWSPDVAWRYLPMARIVRGLLGPRASVLDVGAGGLGIGAYLENPCVLTDFDMPVARDARFVRADAARLPFADRSFDAVVQADVMEHLSPALRPMVVDEMFRVARRLVVIAAPAGPESEAHDRKLAESAHPSNHLRAFLAEHFENGLPSLEELHGLVHEAASRRFRRAEIHQEKNATLALRYLVMRSLVAARNEDVSTRLKLWAPLSRPLAAIRFGRCYRVILSCREVDG